MKPTAPHARRPPTFLWHGLLVLLPVVVLALVGLVSIRQDRALAEQQAKETGQSVAEQLAKDIGRALEEELAGFAAANLEFSTELQGSPAAYSPNAFTEYRGLTKRRQEWERMHPGLELSGMPLVSCALDAEARPVNPPDCPRSPGPPAWLTQLSADQLRLWQSGQAALFRGDTNSADGALREFLAGNPPNDAKVNARFLRLRMWPWVLVPTERTTANEGSAPGRPAGETWRELQALCRVHGQALADSGLPLGQLAVLHVLGSLSSGSGWPSGVREMVAAAILGSPSILTPLVLREADRVLATNAPPRPSGDTNLISLSDAEALRGLRGWWETQERTREALAALREQRDLASETNLVCVFNAASAGPLLAFVHRGPALDVTQPSRAPAAPAGSGFEVRLFPLKLVERAISVGPEHVAVPRYASALVELGGARIAAGDRVEPKGGLLPGKSLLGEAVGRFRVPSPITPREASFAVRLWLADAPLLYARQRQRVLWFAGLVVAAAVTALVGLATARRAFYRQLHLGEMRSNFVSSVSHELRAPIASVRLLAESLERGRVVDEPKRNEYFRLIVQECRRLSSLVENVLDFSRLDQGRKRYEFESTDLRALVDQTVKVLEPYAAERQVSLQSRVTGEPGPIDADGRALQQALVNLIDNAVKHSPAGQTVTVELACPTNADAASSLDPRPSSLVCLSVADHGPGIPADERTRIFDPFYRRGSELRRETQGVGIGLSIVKHIVEAHDGRVRVESEVGKGSRFIIELPAEARGVRGNTKESAGQ